MAKKNVVSQPVETLSPEARAEQSAQRFITETLPHILRSAKARLDQFVIDFQANPIRALEWSQPVFVQAELVRQTEYFINSINEVRETNPELSFAEIRSRVVKQLELSILRGQPYDLSRSTSITGNMIEDAAKVARAELYRHASGSL